MPIPLSRDPSGPGTRPSVARALAAGILLSSAALPAACLGAGAPPGDEPARAREAFEAGLRAFGEATRAASERPSAREEIRELYREAAARFVQAWDLGAESAEVATNAANAFALGGDAGRAVLFYRRALALDPSNEAARSGLEYLRAELPIRRVRRGGAEILKALFFWHEGLAFQVRRRTFLFLFPAAFACFAIALKRRAVFLPLGAFFLGLSLALLGSLLADALGSSLRRDGVIVAEVQGRLGDDRVAYSPSHAKPFPPGTEVTVLEARRPRSGASGEKEPWLHVRLLDGSLSWVPGGAVEMVLAR